MTTKDRSRDDDVIDDWSHTDHSQPDIGKPILPDDRLPDAMEVGDLDDLVAQVDPHVAGDDD